MQQVVRIAVVGEGTDEHGVSVRGPDLKPLAHNALRGCLGVLVERVMQEHLKLDCELLSWLPVDRAHLGRLQPPAVSREMLTDENLLPRFLDKLLRPIRREPSGPQAADLVVLAVDADYSEPFWRAIQRLRHSRSDIADRTVPIVFEPEMEVVLVQSKAPLEELTGLNPCSTAAPDRGTPPKESLRDWFRQHARDATVDAALRQSITMRLDLDDASYLRGVSGWKDLVAGLIRAKELMKS